MKPVKIAATVLVASLALAACGKSVYQQYADEVCACKDAKCREDVEKKYKDKMPKMDSIEEMSKLSASDVEAVGKALECALGSLGAK